MNALTLKNRLRISILGLVVTIVLALSALILQNSVQETFADAEERAHLVAEQIGGYLAARPAASAPGDPLLTQLLYRSSMNSSFVSEILVIDDNGRVVSASNASRVGEIAGTTRPFSDIRILRTWTSLYHLLNSVDDYAVENRDGGHLRIKVMISPAFLRRALVPELRQLIVVALILLLLSGLLIIAISDLVGGSLERIGRDIERISAGDSKEPGEQFESAELANLQVKLSLLGKQYRGAREDANVLRSNIDQMIQRLQEAVLLFDAEGLLQTAGPPAERLLAKGREELIGKTFDGVFPSWTHLGAAIQAAVRLQTPVFDHPVSYARNNMPDAKLLVSVETVNGSDNRPLGTLVTLRDAEMRQELVSHLDISGRIASIHRLTSGVAHEIRNPLNGIALHLELARSKVPDDQSQVASELEIAAKEVLRLDRVVKTFLNFSRPMDLRMTECDLTEMTREVTAQAEVRKEISVSISSPAGNSVVLADRVLSKQAILNVLTNAMEAVNESGEIKVGIEKIFDDYVVTIKDSGAGIAPEIGERIYNLYFTTKPGAAGIGLAETFMVMQLHNGSVDFESHEGNGTSFRLRFPAARTAAQGN